MRDELISWKEKIKKDPSCLMDAPQSVIADFDFMVDAVNVNIKAFNYADEVLKSSRDFLTVVIKREGLLLRSAHRSLQNDLELVIQAVENNGTLFKYLPMEMKVNKKVICAAISSSKGDFLLEAANKVKDNRELMLFAVGCRGTNLMFASDRLKDDKEVVLAAINQNWLALGFASFRLKGSTEILTYALKKNSGALRFANKSLIEERDWVKLMIISNGLTLEKFPAYNSNKDLIKLAIEKNPAAYKFINESLKGDLDFVCEIIDENYKVYNELPEELQNEEKVCIATWKSICAAYVKDYAWFLTSIKNTNILTSWEEYKKTVNPPSFSRFPDYFERLVRAKQRG